MIQGVSLSPGARLRRLGFAPTQLGGGRVGWSCQRNIADRVCEILVTDGQGSGHLPSRARDGALLTVCADGESEHWLALASALGVLVASLERGEMIAPYRKNDGGSE